MTATPHPADSLSFPVQLLALLVVKLERDGDLSPDEMRVVSGSAKRLIALLGRQKVG